MGKPFSFDPRNTHPAQDEFQRMLIAKPFKPNEIEAMISTCKFADVLDVTMLDCANEIEFPFRVHCIALPDFTLSGYLHGTCLFNGTLCIVLSIKKDSEQMFIIKHESIVYLATRIIDPKHELVILIDNRESIFSEAPKV
jgi:hypothetical protein